MITEKYLLIAYDSLSGVIYYDFGDDKKQLFYDYLNADDGFFNDYWNNNSSCPISANDIIDYYEIQDLKLIDLNGIYEISYNRSFIDSCTEGLKEVWELRNLNKKSTNPSYQPEIEVILWEEKYC